MWVSVLVQVAFGSWRVIRIFVDINQMVVVQVEGSGGLIQQKKKKKSFKREGLRTQVNQYLCVFERASSSV